MFKSRPLRIAALVVRILLGALFIVSAIAKLVGIDDFEIYIFTYNVLPLTWSFLMARLVIVAEMIVGLLLISNCFHRVVNWCATLMLLGFTVFLAVAALIGRTDSCHCMGAIMEINPLQSMIKNVVLLFLLLVAGGAKPFPWHPRRKVWVPAVLLPCIGVCVTVFILSAPDNWMFGPSEEVFNEERLDSAIGPEGDLHDLGLDNGRHVVAFLTPGCHFCKMADEKLTHICRRNDLDSAAIVYLTPRIDSTITPLTIDSSRFVRPCYMIDNMTHAHITYGQRPLIFLMENGQVVSTCHYRNIDEHQIVEFLQQSSK